MMKRALASLILSCATLVAQPNIVFHPNVALTPTTYAYRPAVWCVFDPYVCDPFVWIDQGNTIRIRQVAFLHAAGYAGGSSCGVRLHSWYVASVNPTTYATVGFYSWPGTSANPQVFEYPGPTGLVLPWPSGYGVRYGGSSYSSTCTIGGVAYDRPLAVAVLLELQ